MSAQCVDMLCINVSAYSFGLFLAARKPIRKHVLSKSPA